MRKLSRQEKFRDVTIGLEGGVWTLRGEVDSFEARDLAEAFASLEPGVGQVRNEIIVRGADVAPAE
jgi:osmotically-inducible protein OsmY